MKILGRLSCIVWIGLALGCGAGGEKNEPINKGDYTTKPAQSRPHITQPAGAGATPSAPK